MSLNNMKKQQIIKPIVWSISISILKNPLLWFQLFIVSFVIFVFMLVLLLAANLFQYQWHAIPSSLLLATAIGGIFFIVFSLVLILFYARGIPTSYLLNNNRVEQYTLRREKKPFRLLSLFGLASGENVGFTALGASLLAHAREQIVVNWKDVSSVEVYPNLHEIRLKNQWRTMMQVVCPKDQFASISEIINNQIKPTILPYKKKQSNEPSFVKKILLSIIILICGSFLFARLPIHYVGFFTITTIIMAYLSLWSVGLKRTIFAILLILMPIIAVIAAFVFKEVDMSHSGSLYALIIELITIFFFLILGISILLNNKLKKPGEIE